MGILISTSFVMADSPIRLIVNNKEVVGELQPISYQDHVYIPIRSLAEALNCDVLWDGNNNTVIVKSKDINTTVTPNPVIDGKSNFRPPIKTDIVTEQIKTKEVSNIKETTFNGIRAIEIDGITYFSAIDYNRQICRESNSPDGVKYDSNTRTSTIVNNGTEIKIVFNNENVQIYNGTTYFNSKFYK